MLLRLTLCLLLALSLGAQTHGVTLTWVASADDVPGSGLAYNVYRSVSLCTATPSWAKIATVPTKTYEDLAVVPGYYCYMVRATLNNMESVDSNTALAAVPSFPVSGLQATAK